ncbi:hypothetical protein Bbelb_142680 [Branchiostoma belcheri]|nr:hypothetical protein Bbelb_142680 [Branchiostoma belcheri]
MTSQPLMSRATPFWGYSAYSEFPSIEMADKPPECVWINNKQRRGHRPPSSVRTAATVAGQASCCPRLTQQTPAAVQTASSRLAELELTVDNVERITAAGSGAKVLRLECRGRETSAGPTGLILQPCIPLPYGISQVCVEGIRLITREPPSRKSNAAGDNHCKLSLSKLPERTDDSTTRRVFFLLPLGLLGSGESTSWVRRQDALEVCGQAPWARGILPGCVSRGSEINLGKGTCVHVGTDCRVLGSHQKTLARGQLLKWLGPPHWGPTVCTEWCADVTKHTDCRPGRGGSGESSES